MGRQKKEDGTARKPELVKGAARAIDLFEVFARTKRPLTLTELSRLANMPVSSLHALVRTLQDAGYVYSLDSRRIYPTRRLGDIGVEISAHDPILEKILPCLEALRDATGETILLGKRQKDRIVYLSVIEGNQIVRYSAEVGETRPLAVSAIGKAILGSMSVRDLDAALSQVDFQAVTPQTITDRDTLIAYLARGQERGYFVTRGEYAADVMSVATSFTVNGENAGFAIAGPLARLDPQEASLASHLLQTRDAILEACSTGRTA